MSKKYCVCGKPNDLLANFCMGCGKAFSNLTSSPNIKSEEVQKQEEKPLKPSFARKVIPQFPTRQAKRPAVSEGYDDDDVSGTDDIVESIPQLEGLQVEITVPKERKETIGSIAATQGEGPITPLSKTKIKVNKKQILNEYRQEAGSLRPKK